jgi:hypothetical protein
MSTRASFLSRLSTLEALLAPKTTVCMPDACTLMQTVGLTPDSWQAAVCRSK